MLFTHSLHYFLMKGAAGLVGLFTIIIFTRLLSPNDYGIYAILLSGISICHAIFFYWLSLSLGRFYVREKAQLGQLISTIGYGFFLASLFSLLVWGLGVLFFQDISWLKWLFFLPPLVISYSWFELNLRIANVNIDPAMYGYISFAKASLGLLIGSLLYFYFGLNGLFSGIVLSAFVAPLFWMRGTWKMLHINLIDYKVFKRFLSYGLPLAITISLTLVVDSSDRFLIAAMIGEEQAGLYSASYHLVVQTMGFVAAAIYLAAFPMLVRDIETKNSGNIKLGLSQYITLLIAVIVPLLVIFIALSGNISIAVFGRPFRDSATLLMPIIAFGIFASIFKIYFFDLIFQLNHKTLIQIWPALLTALVNIILNVFWIPRYGPMGAAYATLVAFLIGLVVSGIMANRILVMSHPRTDILKVFCAGCAMYLLLLTLESLSGFFALALQLIAGLAMYLVLIIILNVGGITPWLRLHLSK